MHTPEPPRLLGRYEICEELGRGGMAVVYRVLDPVSGEFLAAKQLLAHADPLVFVESCARFEREFHTLSGLSHPRIIEVYDYTLDAGGPFYTMELLDGGDLLGLSPLPWQQACRLFHDVCSSLALVHSRRMVHCDISPRNVRCTKDGRAKLFDFGADGARYADRRNAVVHGTRSGGALRSGRARRSVFARSDAVLRANGSSRVLGARLLAPCRCLGRQASAAFAFLTGVPEALDRLTLSLLSLEASERPRNAFEVMQRLAVIADIQHSDTLNVSHAYLSSPVLVGRAPLMAAIEREFARAWNGEGGSVLVRGAAGLGRSRVLDASVIAAKLRGVSVVRGSADAARSQDFAVAQTLCEQLLEIMPAAAIAAANAEHVHDSLFAPNAEKPGQLKLVDLTQPRLARATVQDALIRWLLELSKLAPIAIAVDDVQRIDEPSAALLAQCAAQSGGRRLILLLTMQSGTNTDASNALEVLMRRSHTFELAPLSEAETVTLLTSVFGDVQHVGVVGHAVHTLAGGNPRLCLELARHLVDSGAVRYADGNWTLPERLSATDLPESAETALRARVSALSTLARQLLEAQALASHQAFPREDYAQLSPGVPAAHVEQALAELVTREFLVSDGRVYWLAHRSWASALVAHMSEAEQRERHAALAAI